jgi:cobyric acid synthase CobQ
MEVMEEWERKLIGGFLVNRFRGDESLLHSAHEYIYDLTGKPVLGTIPNINDLGIPEEDSVSFKAGKLQKKRPNGEHVEIALINLPHISNFTDIEPFVDEPDVYLKIVSSPSELGSPDSIIVPGSKNVVGDLVFLQQTGLDDAIVQKAANGVEIVGICGGYQMLGQTIHDPYRIESDARSVSALRLVPVDTTLARHKTLTRKAGKHLPTGLDVHGYEIHHGLSSGVTKPLLKFDDGTNCGTCHDSLAIWGAYLHGIFDADIFRRSFIDKLRKRKGLEGLGRIAAPYNLERAFDTLADVVRKSIDMDAVYSLLEK